MSTAIYNTFYFVLLMVVSLSCSAKEGTDETAAGSAQSLEAEPVSLEAEKGKIKGQLKGFAATEVKLFAMSSGFAVEKASAKVKDGSFALNLPQDLPLGLYTLGPDQSNSFQVVLPDGAITVTGELASPKIEGEKGENEAYAAYKAYNEELNKKYTELNGQVNALQGLKQSDPDAFEKEFAKLRPKYEELRIEQAAAYERLIEEKKGTFAAQAMEFLKPEAQQTEGFPFKKEDFENDALARSNIYLEKVYGYLKNGIPQQYEAYDQNLEKVLAFADGEEESDQAIYLMAIQVYGQINQEKRNTLAKTFIGKFEDSPFAEALQQSLPPMVGDAAPDIKLEAKDGGSLSLSEMEGKVVLLDFWASWCKPCRNENPTVVKAYEAYKDKGFTVFSVSLDKQRNAWVKAIEQDGLVWDNHVSDLQGWRSAGAAAYKVRSIPATYLIDREGKIIAQNLRGAALEKKLDEILNQ